MCADELGHSACIRDDIDQIGGIYLHHPLHDSTAKPVHIVGADHRRICGRQFQRHGAGRRKCGIGGGKGHAFGMGRRFHIQPARVQNLGHQGPVGDGGDHHVGHGGGCGHHHAQARMRGQHGGQGRAQTRGQTRHLSLARSGQDQQQRVGGLHPVLHAELRHIFRRGLRFGHHGMPDKVAVHAGGLHVRWLKREQRQHVVDHRLCGLGDAAFQVAVFGQHFHDAHDAQLGHVKAAGQPLRLHLGATDAVKGHVRHQRPQPCHQRAAQLVA